MKWVFKLTTVLLLIAVMGGGLGSAFARQDGWYGEYFNNQTLSGSPILTRTDSKIQFDWGGGGPAGVGADNFSVRWTRSVYLDEGEYKFLARSDDGIRAWIDGSSIISAWEPRQGTWIEATRYVTAGTHFFQVEYYEDTGGAVAEFGWIKQTQNVSWNAKYFNNTDLTGAPVLERTDNAIDFDWGGGSPAPGTVNADNFSVRWEATVSLSAGTWRFTTTTDDGVRLWVDGNQIINQWKTQPPTTYSADIYLNDGNHNIKMEYFEGAETATAKLAWTKPGSYTPVPTAAPTYAPSGDWYAQYFNNMSLSGSPVLTRNEANLDYDWGFGSPGWPVPADYFSARWTRSVYFNSTGTWRFTVTADDGVRLWVNNQLIIDQWKRQSATFGADVYVNAGTYEVRMDYFEQTEAAKAKLSWYYAGAPQPTTPPPTTAPPAGSWYGEYYNNMTLSGSPVLTRNESSINYDWGFGSPGWPVPADYFSARWTQTAYFNTGTYTFTATTDDGVRVWVDNQLVIDAWRAKGAIPESGSIYLSAGNHTVKMEYFERTEAAIAQLNWSASTPATPLPTSPPPTTPPTSGNWLGEYYNNMSLSGWPVLTRYDSTIGFNWGWGAPAWGLPADFFSARWTQSVWFDAGTYTFTAYTDDGVRVWIDSQLVIDQWQVQSPRAATGVLTIGAGNHTVKMEYFEQRERAVAMLSWTKTGGSSGTSIVVDNADSGFQRGGPSGSWGATSSVGYNGGMYWTYTTDAIAQTWSRWVPGLPQSGNYRVEVFIPSRYAGSRQVQYRVFHGGRMDATSVDQSRYYDDWVTLGTYWFNADGSEYVYMDNLTGEGSRRYYLGVDAVRFTLVP